MKSMKLTDEEKKDMSAPQPVTGKDSYPYGLSIHIDSEMCRRLEIDNDVSVGDEFMILAKAKVKEVRQEMNEHPNDVSMTLQITDMDVKEKEDEKDTASELYGG